MGRNGKLGKRKFVPPEQAELFCKRVATRREHAAEKQKCDEIDNGSAGLNENLWLRVFKHLSKRENARFCTPVCKAWRNWTYERTGKSFSFNACCRCTQCLNAVQVDPWRIPSIESFAHYIYKRMATLKTVKLFCGDLKSYIEINAQEQTFRQLGNCDKLEHLEFYGTPGRQLSGGDMYSLPQTLRTLKTNMAIEDHALSAWRLLSIRELEFSMRLNSFEPDTTFNMLRPLNRLERLTIRNCNECEMPTQTVELHSLKYFEISGELDELSRLSQSLLQFVMMCTSLETFYLCVQTCLELDFAQLKHHESLKNVHVRSRYCTTLSMHSLYTLPQIATLEVGDIEPGEVNDLMFVSEMEQSNLLRFSSGTSRRMVVELPLLLQAPRLELIDIWAANFTLGLTLETKKEILPTDRPICIKIDSDSEFLPDELTALRNLGFEITHSRPSCACCGTALSTWFAKYTNEKYGDQGLNPTGLTEPTTMDLPCRWGTCTTCNENEKGNAWSEHQSSASAGTL